MPDLKKPVTDEIATAKKDIDMFAGWLGRMENPDTVLRTEAGGKGLKLYDEAARDAHVKSVLQTRALAVIGKEWEVLPGVADDEQAQEIADFVKDALLSCNFDQARQELLKAVLYGFFVGEVIWGVKNKTDGRGVWLYAPTDRTDRTNKTHMAEGGIVPVKIRCKHPRRFSFTMERDLRLLTPSNMIEGEPVPERKFVCFTYGSSDNPYGEGLGQVLWWLVWFKKHGIKFWLVFLEKFGMPTSHGKYPRGTDPAEQQKLLDAIDAMQTETGIATPDDMKIELIEASRTGRVEYGGLCEYMDKLISKAVLGQTATTEGTPGKLGGEDAQNEVRGDILKADADLLCECLNDTLIRWIVDYNFAGVTEYPKLWVRCEEGEDLAERIGVDKALAADLRLPMGRKYFYETYAVPEPEEGEELIEPAGTGARGEEDIGQIGRTVGAGPGPAPTAQKGEFSEAVKKKPDDMDRGALEAQAEVDRLADDEMEKAVGMFEGWLDEIKGFLDAAGTLAYARDNVMGLYDALDSRPLAGHLADVMIKADRIGVGAYGHTPVHEAEDFAEASWGSLPFPEAVDYHKAKAFTLAGVTKADLLTGVKDEITTALENGVSLGGFKKGINSLFDRHGYTRLAPYRIETIYRTNMQAAYHAGRFRQMTDPAVLKARPYWRYSAVMDKMTRPAHAALHGKVFRADDPFWRTWYPPNGFNCRCTVTTLSDRDLARRKITVETLDPTGALIEPVDPATGEVYPAAPLIPDPGWGGRSGSLEKLLADNAAGAGGIVWKEAPDQLAPAEMGRPKEKEIPAKFYKASPGQASRLEDLIQEHALSRSEALTAIEAEYRRVMGISPNDTMGILKGPDGEIMSVDISALAHAMQKRADGRERFIRHFRDVIEDPYEIVLTEYVSGRMKSKARKKYIGLYTDKTGEGVVIVAELTPYGGTMWNVINAKKGTIDRQRKGLSVIYGKE